MTCDQLLWNKLLNRGMLTSEERKQEKDMKELAEQMLHIREGFGIAVAEALLLGLPVVAWRIPVLRNYIRRIVIAPK
jgi:glycosyltransferase involved in cell wall biosynthesis